MLETFLDRIGRDLSQGHFLGMTGFEWLILLLLATLFAFGLGLLRRVLVGRLRKFSRRTDIWIDDALATLLEATRGWFLAVLGLMLAALVWPTSDLVDFIIQQAVFILLLLQVVRWGSSLVDFGVRRYKEARLDEDPAAVTAMQAGGFIARLLLWSVVVMLALDNFGVDITALVAGLGVGGIAVALALQNILGDLFASLSIVIDKPFVVGDFVIVDDLMGTVERVGLKTTRVRSLGGEQLVFSNSDLLSSRVRNYKRMMERRIVFEIGVVYETSYEDVAAIPAMIREAIEAQEEVRFDRAHFKAYGDFALRFEAVYYVLVPDYNRYMDIQQAINLALFKRFEEAGIEFAYPTQKLYMRPFGGDGNGRAAAQSEAAG